MIIEQDHIKLNICGKKFILLKSAITKYPLSRLAKLVNNLQKDPSKFILCDSFSIVENEYYFHRSPHVFKTVLEFYISGSIHDCSSTVCDVFFHSELEFWGILPHYKIKLCNCYLYRINSERKQRQAAQASPATPRMANGKSPNRAPSPGIIETSLANQLSDIMMPRPVGAPRLLLASAESSCNGDVPMRNTTQQRCDSEDDVFKICETEGSQKSAKFQDWQHFFRPKVLFQMTTILIILTNISIIVLDSLPGYHWSSHPYKFTPKLPFSVLTKTTNRIMSMATETASAAVENTSMKFNNPLSVEQEGLSATEVVVIRVIDWICTLWFTVEFVFRTWQAEHKLRFFIEFQSIVDILAIIPSYIEAVFKITGNEGFPELALLKILRIFRVFRIFRILKLARYESSFKVIAVCLRESSPELSLLSVYLLISTLLFGSLIYYAENEEEGTFYISIPHGIWWSIVTHFGYADAPPTTVWGKLIAGVASIWGVIFMAFPISILVDRFSEFFSRYKVSKHLERANKMAVRMSLGQQQRHSLATTKISVDETVSPNWVPLIIDDSLHNDD